jgi:hypothetical protein
METMNYPELVQTVLTRHTESQNTLWKIHHQPQKLQPLRTKQNFINSFTHIHRNLSTVSTTGALLIANTPYYK